MLQIPKIFKIQNYQNCKIPEPKIPNIQESQIFNIPEY